MTTPHHGNPTDLITLRAAADHTAMSVEVIRKWIYSGKGGKKLQTYREPGKPEIVLVSQAAVMFFKEMKNCVKRTLATGGLGLRFQDDDAASVRKLALLMSNRIGIPISYTEALRGAIQRAIQWEESRAKHASEHA